MDEKIIEELTTMRKELQNIRAILQFQTNFSESRVVRVNHDGSKVRFQRNSEDPLEDLRKLYHID